MIRIDDPFEKSFRMLGRITGGIKGKRAPHGEGKVLRKEFQS